MEQTLHSERKISDDFELARHKASRLNSAAESKPPRFDSPVAPPNSSVSQPYYPGNYDGLHDTSNKIHIPNGKVGVIVGRGGGIIKNLQQRLDARIQITRDSDADPTSTTMSVDLMWRPHQVGRAEELISEAIAKTEAVARGGPSGSFVDPMYAGGEQFVVKVSNDKVALIVSKGGETIKSTQSKSRSRIQVWKVIGISWFTTSTLDNFTPPSCIEVTWLFKNFLE